MTDFLGKFMKVFNMNVEKCFATYTERARARVCVCASWKMESLLKRERERKQRARINLCIDIFINSIDALEMGFMLWALLMLRVCKVCHYFV